MDFIGKAIEIVDNQELSERLKNIYKKGYPIYGLDLSNSKPFDDYLLKILDTTNTDLSEFSELVATLTKNDLAEIFDARSESIIGDLLNGQSSNVADKIANKEVLHIPEDYSFDDIPAKKPFLSILDEARVDFENDEFDELPTIIEVGNKVFGTLGNFSMIIGKAKSGKTFLTTLLASAAIKGQDESKLLTVNLPEHKSKVVIFDTEQSKSHTALIGKRVKELIGDYKPGKFDLFSLRKFPIDKRQQALEELFTRHNDIGLVIIDGVKDLVSEINNEKEASQIGNKLLEWTQTYNLHIVVVLHQNKGNKDARGHIGGELQNKAETTVSVTKRNGVSVVSSEFTRNDDFSPFAIGLKPVTIGKNETVIPFINDGYKFTTKGKGPGKIAITPNSISIETHKGILQELKVYCLKKQMGKEATKIKIYEIAENYKLSFKKSIAQKFLSYYEEKGWIQMVKHNGKGRPFVKVENDSIK